MASAKKGAAKSAFKPLEFVVYPAHGVGQVQTIETTEFAGSELELIVVTFPKDKMTLRVPVAKATASGMRKLAASDTVDQALTTLTGRELERGIQVGGGWTWAHNSPHDPGSRAVRYS